jgi:toxin FitB
VSWLLDTCVISELARPKPSTFVVDWVHTCDETELFLSVITIGELEKGIAKLPGSAKRTLLERWVRHDLAERFRDRLLVIDSNVAARWGALVGQSESRGQPLPVIDSLIAATSLQHDFTVVTRNTDDLERCGARCFNPWIGTHANRR